MRQNWQINENLPLINWWTPNWTVQMSSQQLNLIAWCLSQPVVEYDQSSASFLQTSILPCAISMWQCFTSAIITAITSLTTLYYSKNNYSPYSCSYNSRPDHNFSVTLSKPVFCQVSGCPCKKWITLNSTNASKNCKCIHICMQIYNIIYNTYICVLYRSSKKSVNS